MLARSASQVQFGTYSSTVDYHCIQLSTWLQYVVGSSYVYSYCTSRQTLTNSNLDDISITMAQPVVLTIAFATITAATAFVGAVPKITKGIQQMQFDAVMKDIGVIVRNHDSQLSLNVTSMYKLNLLFQPHVRTNTIQMCVNSRKKLKQLRGEETVVFKLQFNRRELSKLLTQLSV
jgi:hypothetical protein